jgi:preprotein translocase subunit SecG
MTTVLMVLLAVASLVLIASILLQSGSSAGLSGSIGGGAEQLFGKKKSRGYEAILSKIAAVSAILFIVLSLAIVTLEASGTIR